MASIESLGLGSGVLTTDLVDQIISAEREVTELRLNNRQELIEAKITAYGEIRSLMSNMQTAVNRLASPSAASLTKVTSSDESILTATTSLTADPGKYDVEVLNTAKAHSLATSSFESFDEIIGTGKLVFSFGTNTYDGSDNLTGQDLNTERKSATIEIDESSRTLSGVRDAINNAGIGVTANIINDGSGYRLLVTSDESGEENAMRIEARDENDNLLTNGLSALAYNENQTGSSNMEETSRGEDAQLEVNGLSIRRSSNQVTEVINGVTLNLTGADVGNPVSVVVSADAETLSENIQSFVESYNSLKDFVDSLSSYDADAQQGGLLLGDSTMRSIQGQIRSLISQPIPGLTGEYRSLTELGVNTNRDNNFLLDFDQSTFNKAIAEERESIVGILSRTGRTSDSQVVYVNDSINTQSGEYDVEITQLASQAKYLGASLDLLDFTNPVTIDSGNNSFRINVNGKSEEITLTRGDYTSGDDLAKELSVQINSAAKFSDAGYSVDVEYSAADKAFSITSNKYGSDSQVYIESVSGNTANTLGFSEVGSGTYKGVALTTINADAFSGKGAKTDIGNRTVNSDVGIDFSTNNATFDLSIDGAAAVTVTVNQDAEGQDLNDDGTFGDRLDTLQAIQTAIDASSLSGAVTASFDDNGYLRFETTDVGDTKSIEITAVGTTSSDNKLGLDANQGAKTNGRNAGVTFDQDVNFRVKVDFNESDGFVTVPAGTYVSGDALATEIQNQLAATLGSDPNFSGVVRGATTETGSRDISTNINFADTNAGFRLNVSGEERDILINADSGDNIQDIQDALDAAYGQDVVTASLDGSGLKLTTDATGHTEYIEVISDGRGARSSSFADITTGYDFSAGGQNASFTLTVDGIDIDVDVTGDGTSGSNDEESNLSVIQQALDDALVATGEFAAGDIRAAVDGSGQLYFETIAKEGVKTASTFGASASIEVSNVGGSGATSLGLADDSSSNGYDGFGLQDGRTFGVDLDPVVTYNYDSEADLGSFNIQIGGEASRVRFNELDSDAIGFMGLQSESTYEEEKPTGKDVEGLINGVVANGSGQFLRAVDGNVKATNGYYIGDESIGFDSPVELDSTNNSFTINIDGVEAEIELEQPATYNSGNALAQALQTAINDNEAFASKDIEVKVEYTDDPESFANNKFGIISASTGSDSSVEISQVSAEAAEVFGFVRGKGDGESGKEAVGTVDKASGLRLKITGGELGDRGSVTYITGFGDQLKNLLDNYLDASEGFIATKLSGFDDDLEVVDVDKARLDARIEAQEARLKAQFLYNDAIIQTLNTTLDYVKQQFEVLNGSKK